MRYIEIYDKKKQKHYVNVRTIEVVVDLSSSNGSTCIVLPHSIIYTDERYESVIKRMKGGFPWL
jgi:hypothetical protein